jgi:hypothetical protein
VAWIFFGLRELLRFGDLYRVTELARALASKRACLALLIILLLSIPARHLSTSGGVELGREIRRISVECLAKPGVTIVAHLVFFGPILFLTIFCWRRFTGVLHRYGFGMTVFMMVHFLSLSLDSESRRSIIVFPFLVAFTVKLLKEDCCESWLVWFLAALSFVYSKVWLLFNAYPWTTANPQEWPLQLLFMNIGPWMTNQMYVAQGSVVLVTGFLVHYLWVFSRLRRTLEASSTRKAG